MQQLRSIVLLHKLNADWLGTQSRLTVFKREQRLTSVIVDSVQLDETERGLAV